MKIAILALSCSHGPWDKLLERGPCNTWLKNDLIVAYKKVTARRVRKLDLILNRVLESRFASQIWRTRDFDLSNIGVSEVPENNLVIDINENWANLTIKTIKSLEYCLANFEFDYLIRINSTAYIELEKLIKQIEIAGLPKYAGPVLKNKKFVSGWTIILSREAVELLVKENRQEVIFDDEHIGKTLLKHSILPYPIDYCEISDNHEVALKLPLNISLWRFKSCDEFGSRIDDMLMTSFHERKNKDEEFI